MTQAQLLTQDQVEKIAKALSDERRLHILRNIRERGDLVCNEIQEVCTLSQPTISHHVKILSECGLLKTEKEGRFLRLSVNQEILDAFTQQLHNWFH
jgi:ArsR family transcriptional regulator, arsenate/arsenite/antimonite-responsive transcriptional repressor